MQREAIALQRDPRLLLRVSLGALLALAFAGPARAHDAEPVRNQVSFQVERTREVANDWVTASIGLTEEDSDAARLADRVNRAMKAALDRARMAEGVKVRSGGYQTYPVHDDGKIVRWRASQDLLLESADVDALSALLGELQGQLQLRGVHFSVSPEKRREVEASLVAEALGAFQQRAKQVQGELGARDYALVSVHIQTQGEGHPPMPMQVRAQSMSEMAPAPPAFEGGESTISVHVNGTIELER